MNALFALVIVTASGPQMGPGQFDTYAECQVVANKLAMDDIPAYCIKSQPVDIEKEMSKMVNMLKTFQKEMEKQ